MIWALDGEAPTIHPTAWVAPDAQVIGRVRIGAGASVWFGAVLRGDTESVDVGEGANVQDLCVLHTDEGFPLVVGPGCTVGHRAVVHGCEIGEGSLVGMGAVVLNGARIGRECLVGAGALVTEGRAFDPRTLILGSPARAARALNEAAVGRLRLSALHYARNAERFRRGLARA